jgi:hypothetical protein
VIDLGAEDDPDALMAMLRFCYHDHDYKLTTYGKDTAGQHIAMYKLADLYDIPDLRQEATGILIATMCPYQREDGHHQMSNKVIRSIQRVLGPEADSFADQSIQQRVYEHVVGNTKLFFQNPLFRSLLADGVIFNEPFSYDFTDKIGEMISTRSQRFHGLHFSRSPHPPFPDEVWTSPVSLAW